MSRALLASVAAAAALFAAIPAATAMIVATGPDIAQAATPAAPPPAAGQHSPVPLQPGDPFGEEVTLPERTIVYVKGSGTWDQVFEPITAAFRTLNQHLGKTDIKAAGKAMTIYTRTDDKGFDFQAALPVSEPPKVPPKTAPKAPQQDGVEAGPAPAGKALKFTHRGSFDALNTTYEAITNYLDERRLEAKDLFIEEYATEPTEGTEDRLVVTIFVPIR